MVNMQNVGQVVGRLTRNPRIVTNRDGSRKVFLTVAVSDAYIGRDGKRSAQFVPLEAFIPANRGDGIYSFLDAGAAVSAAYSVHNNNYMLNGKMHYSIILHIESIRLGETKEAAELRRSHRSGNESMTNTSVGRKRKNTA